MEEKNYNNTAKSHKVLLVNRGNGAFSGVVDVPVSYTHLFRTMVHGRGKKGGADRLFRGKGMYDHPSGRLCDLGEYPERA